MNDDTPDPYTLPDNDTHPANYAARVMQHPTHAHLADNEVTFGWLMRTTPKVKAGRITLGSVHDTKTMAQGGFKDLFTMMLERLLGTVPQTALGQVVHQCLAGLAMPGAAMATTATA